MKVFVQKKSLKATLKSTGKSDCAFSKKNSWYKTGLVRTNLERS